MTACRCNTKLDGDDRPGRKAASSSSGTWGCPRGFTPCVRCCSYVNPEEAADVAAGSTSAASAAEALSPAADAASPLRPASNRTVAANWYQRGSGCAPSGAPPCCCPTWRRMLIDRASAFGPHELLCNSIDNVKANKTDNT